MLSAEIPGATTIDPRKMNCVLSFDMISDLRNCIFFLEGGKGVLPSTHGYDLGTSDLSKSGSPFDAPACAHRHKR